MTPTYSGVGDRAGGSLEQSRAAGIFVWGDMDPARQYRQTFDVWATDDGAGFSAYAATFHRIDS